MGCCGASPTNEDGSRGRKGTGKGDALATGGDLENELTSGGVSPESIKYYGADIKSGVMKVGKVEYIKTDPLKNNFTSTNNVTSEFVNKGTAIMNYNHEPKDINLKEIKEFCNMYLNEKEIPFTFEYKFPNEGKYNFKYHYQIALLNTSNMFFGCKTLIALDLSNFHSKFIKNMSSMFYGCVNLEQLNLKNFDTSHAITMSNMFAYCRSLKNLDCSSFNTSNVTTMTNMFQGCSGLVDLNLKNFTTENITFMEGIFDGVKVKSCKLTCNDKKILAEFK